MLNANRYGLCSILVVLFLSSPVIAQDKHAADIATIERFSDELEAAKTKEKRDALFAANKELVTLELQRILVKKGENYASQGNYAQAVDVLQLAQIIAQQKGDKVSFARASNVIGNVYRLQGRYANALEQYQNNLVLSEGLNESEGIVLALNGIGNIHYLTSNFAQALVYLKRSLSLSEETQNKPGIAGSLNVIGNIYLAQGDYIRALKEFNKCLVVSQELKDKVMIARMFNNIGVVYNSTGNYDQALNYYHKGLSMREEVKDRLGIATSLNNIGNIYYLLGNYEKALEYYRKSLIISEEMKNKAGITRTLNSIGAVHNSQGNFLKALEYFQKSLIICEELKDRIGIASILGNIGIIHKSQGNYRQALEYYSKSLSLSVELKNKAVIANTLGSIGNIYCLQGKYKQALEQFHRSLEISEEMVNKNGIASMLNCIGYVYYLQQKPDEALKYYNKGLHLFEEIKRTDKIAETLYCIGMIYFLQGNHEKVIELYSRVLEGSKQIDDLKSLWPAYYLLGLSYLALNRFDQSKKALNESISVIETLQNQVVGGEQAQQLFFEDKISPFHKMADLLIIQNNYSESLLFSERAKSRVLLDVLQRGRLIITKAMNLDEQVQEKKLKNDLTSLNTQLYREKQRETSDASRIADLEKELDKARLDFEAFQTSLFAAHPELKTQRAEVKPVTLDEASSLLPNPQSALLEFVVAEEKTFLFVITQPSKPAKVGSLRQVSKQSEPSSPILKVYTIDVKQKDLAERVRSFREMLAKKELGFRKPGRELYDLLLKPAEEQLKGITTLVIVPEGVLWELPFQALQTSPKRYLLEDSTLFYSPSLTALREMSKPRKQDSNDKTTTKTLLAFGNPSLGDENKKSAASVLMGGNLEPLPGAEEQVKLLARLYGIKQSKYYIGPEAREQQVKAEAGGYRILQFATHGILNDISPMYSHLVLSQTDEKSGEDGLLEAWEIMQMDLKADMAVLAACETARGRVSAGEGVIGLTWAFFVAGCPTTVVSQWKVEDEATKDLMLEFHKQLKIQVAKPKLTKAEALRQAALKILRAGKNTHPFYWAGFVLIGKGR